MSSNSSPLIKSIFLILFFPLITSTAPAYAMQRGGYALVPNTSYENIIPASDFDQKYKSIIDEYNDITTRLPKKFQQDKLKTATPRPYENPELAELRTRFFAVQKLKKLYDPVHDLKETLNAMYLKGVKDPIVDKTALNAESLRLALGLMDRIAYLKKDFKSFFIPVVHNMLISVGLKHRGACKDWAEDLLEYLKPTERQFFKVTWGEANPHKFNEHNVAVLYPKWGQFADGVLVDPWRTSGRPFWLSVRDDHHYKWHQWPLYEVY